MPALEAIEPFAAAPAGSSWFTSAASFAGALALHGAVLWAVMAGPAQEPLGAAGIDLDAISVEISLVSASALESRAQEAATAASTDSDIDMEEGSVPTTAANAAPENEPEQSLPRTEPLMSEPPSARPDEQQPDADPEPEVTHAISEPETPAPVDDVPELPPLRSIPTDVAKAFEAPASPREPANEPTSEPAPELAPLPVTPPPAAVPASQASQAQQAGGVAARANRTAATQSAGAAAASRGSIGAFTRSVVAALGKTRPKTAQSRTRGTVKVAFAIAESGGLAYVRVVASSGNPTLDKAAISAVQRAAFPTPPRGLSVAERTYEIPYHFR